ncbi:MAG TPA: hypothetical protein VGW35_18325 [Methylomirabilota bacterium]|jgi:hypothetical protein|nr:hypothetical protein [Methylomirabilota bacterium]
MGEAITESAHYVAVVRGGGTDLFLIQGGRLEASGMVSILWDRRAETEAAGARPAGALSAARRRAFRILSRVF